MLSEYHVLRYSNGEGPLYWADDAITDIFAKLRFRKVIPKIKNKAAATLAVLF